MAAATNIYSLIPDDMDGDAIPNWINAPARSKDDQRLPIGGHLDPSGETDGRGTGFPPGMPKPVLRFDRTLRDDEFVDIILTGRPEWMLSARAKEVFEAVDPSALEFCETMTRFPDGTEGPRYWLCDVVRFLAAVDEHGPNVSARSFVGPRTGRELELLDLGVSGGHLFHRSILNGHHIFRMLQPPHSVFVDQSVVDAIREAGLAGMQPFLEGVAHGQ